jgi:hypothetical protein
MRPLQLGTESLRRQAVSEFPNEEPGQFGQRVREVYARGGRHRPAPDERLEAPSQLEQLERLSSLHREGALSDDEFEGQKRRILAGPSH